MIVDYHLTKVVWCGPHTSKGAINLNNGSRGQASISSENALKRFAREKTKIAELNAFYDKFNTLLLSAEKATISLFRSAIGMDCFVEEFFNRQEQITKTVQPIYRYPAFKETKDTPSVQKYKALC